MKIAVQSFSPSNPKTKPKLEKVAYYESFTDFEPMIEEAIEKRTTIELPLQQKDDFEDLL